MPVQSVETQVKPSWVQWSRDLLLDMQRLWCDCEKPWRPFSLKGRTGGDTGCPLWRPVGLLRCHLHTMWQTPLVWPFFTLPHPLPSMFLDKWVKTPARALPQARTDTAWTPPVTASRSITSHLNPPCSPSSPSFLFFFSCFRLSLLILWLQDFYQGLAQTYATCHPPSTATLPEARCSLRLEVENHCDTSPTTIARFHSLSLTVMEEALRSFPWMKVSTKQYKNTLSKSHAFKD